MCHTSLREHRLQKEAVSGQHLREEGSGLVGISAAGAVRDRPQHHRDRGPVALQALHFLSSGDVHTCGSLRSAGRRESQDAVGLTARRAAEASEASAGAEWSAGKAPAPRASLRRGRAHPQCGHQRRICQSSSRREQKSSQAADRRATDALPASGMRLLTGALSLRCAC